MCASLCIKRHPTAQVEVFGHMSSATKNKLAKPVAGAQHQVSAEAA